VNRGFSPFNIGRSFGIRVYVNLGPFYAVQKPRVGFWAVKDNRACSVSRPEVVC